MATRVHADPGSGSEPIILPLPLPRSAPAPGAWKSCQRTIVWVTRFLARIAEAALAPRRNRPAHVGRDRTCGRGALHPNPYPALPLQ